MWHGARLADEIIEKTASSPAETCICLKWSRRAKRRERGCVIRIDRASRQHRMVTRDFHEQVILLEHPV